MSGADFWEQLREEHSELVDRCIAAEHEAALAQGTAEREKAKFQNQIKEQQETSRKILDMNDALTAQVVKLGRELEVQKAETASCIEQWNTEKLNLWDQLGKERLLVDQERGIRKDAESKLALAIEANERLMPPRPRNAAMVAVLQDLRTGRPVGTTKPPVPEETVEFWKEAAHAGLSTLGELQRENKALKDGIGKALAQAVTLAAAQQSADHFEGQARDLKARVTDLEGRLKGALDNRNIWQKAAEGEQARAELVHELMQRRQLGDEMAVWIYKLIEATLTDLDESLAMAARQRWLDFK